MGKRYEVSTPRPKNDGGTFWLRVGSAFTNDNGLITVYLDSYPIPDREGKVKMMLFEPKPAQQAGNPTLVHSRTLSEEIDDEIPF